MKLIKCDKCGMVNPEYDSGTVTVHHTNYGKAKQMDLCDSCLAEIEQYLGISTSYQFKIPDQSEN